MKLGRLAKALRAKSGGMTAEEGAENLKSLGLTLPEAIAQNYERQTGTNLPSPESCLSTFRADAERLSLYSDFEEASQSPEAERCFTALRAAPNWMMKQGLKARMQVALLKVRETERNKSHE